MYYLIYDDIVTPILDYRILDDGEITITTMKNTKMPKYPNRVLSNGEYIRKVDYVKDLFIFDSNFNDGIVFYNTQESAINMRLEFGVTNRQVSYIFDHYNFGYNDDNIKCRIRQLKINKLMGK